MSVKRELSEENRKFNPNWASPIAMANHGVLRGCK